MGVSIDKTWEHDPAGCVDDFDVVRQLARDFVRRSDGGNHSVAHPNAAVRDDRELAQLTSNARALRTSEREQLRGMEDGYGIHTTILA